MFNNNNNPGADKMKTTNGTNGAHKNDVSAVNMISEGTEVIGTLKTTSDIRIAGKIDGEAEVDGKIIIASSGHVNGNVDSNDADIAGCIEGEVHVSNKLTLRQSAVVNGDLYAQSLVVEEGATLNGACHMRDSNSAKKSSSGGTGSKQASGVSSSKKSDVKASPEDFTKGETKSSEKEAKVKA